MKRFLFLAFLCFTYFALSLFYQKGWQWSGVLRWDAFGYYSSLPAHAYYSDLHYFSIPDSIKKKYNYKDYEIGPLIKTETGDSIPKYGIGVAITSFPFFVVAHFLSKPLGYTQDGFSLIYQLLMQLSVCFYVCIGFIFLYDVLRKYFSENITALVVFAIALATNLAYYQGSYMTHGFTFCLYAILLWLTDNWYRKNKQVHFVLIGLVCGWIMLVRPTDCVCFLIPALWRIEWSWKRFRQIVIWILLALITFSPQLFYWHHYTGAFYFNAYAANGEGFDWLAPHVFEVLINYNHGWFIYTPVMLMALFGMILFIKNRIPYAAAIVSFFILNLYIVSAWHEWTYGGSYGMRALVQSYAIMAFPMAVCVQGLMKYFRIIYIWIFVFLCMALNFFKWWQTDHGILNNEIANAPYYRHMFFRTDVTTDDLKILDGCTDCLRKNDTDFIIEKLAEVTNADTSAADRRNFTDTVSAVLDLKKQRPELIRAEVIVLTGMQPYITGMNKLAIESFDSKRHKFLSDGIRIENKTSMNKWDTLQCELAIPKQASDTVFAHGFIRYSPTHELAIRKLTLYGLYRKRK